MKPFLGDACSRPQDGHSTGRLLLPTHGAWKAPSVQTSSNYKVVKMQTEVGQGEEKVSEKCQKNVLSLFDVLALPCCRWDVSAPSRDWTCAPAVGAGSLNHWTTGEVLGECLCIREPSKTILKLAGGILLLTTERMITHSYRWMKSSPHRSLLDKGSLACSVSWGASKSRTVVFCSSDSLLTWWPSIQSLIVRSCWWSPATDY